MVLDVIKCVLSYCCVEGMQLLCTLTKYANQACPLEEALLTIMTKHLGDPCGGHRSFVVMSGAGYYDLNMDHHDRLSLW